jgi:hypothetical protein
MHLKPIKLDREAAEADPLFAIAEARAKIAPKDAHMKAFMDALDSMASTAVRRATLASRWTFDTWRRQLARAVASTMGVRYLAI